MLTADRLRGRTGAWNILFGAHCLFFFVPAFLLVLFAYSTELRNPGAWIRPICWLIVIASVWCLWSWYRLTGTLFGPYGVFLLAAILFNGGRAILEVFGLNEFGIEVFASREGFVLFSFSTDIVLKSLLLVLVGLVAFHAGALLAVRSKKGNSASGPYVAPSILRLTGGLFIGLSIIPTIVLLREAVGVVLSSGYFGLFERQAATGLEATPRELARFLIPGAFFLLAGSQRYPMGRYIALILILFYVLIQFFLGSRLWSMMPLVAFVWLWHRTIRPLPKAILITGAALLLFVISPTIAVVREVVGQERLSLAVYLNQFFSIENPAIAIINEMGRTLLTVAATIQLVPATPAFQWGLGYGYALLTLVPNLFWEVHPSSTYGSPAYWLVWTIAPYTAERGGGYGYSFIAEAYLEFGWVGAPVMLAIIGFLFVRLLRWAERSGNPARLATVASFIAFFLIYARGQASLVIRPLVWYALVPYIFAIFLHRYFRKAHR